MDTKPDNSSAENIQRPPLYALVIGIDEYKDTNIHRLSGAVADADAVCKFLESHLHVPKDRIVNLRNEKATRSAMMSAIKNIASTPEATIGADNPILIYYAGHGGQTNTPEPWKPSLGPRIEMLLPYDFVSTASDTREGQGLFDQTLSILLADIAERKSDNITVILDCCHSSSQTRSHDTIRGIELPEDYTIPVDALDTKEIVRLSKNKVGNKSHVLLASCTRGQTARETQGRGAFTVALLALLEKQGVDHYTYREVIKALPDIPSQSPQCIGHNQDRILFSRMKIHQRRYPIHSVRGNPGKYILRAGTVEGITKGAIFSVFLPLTAGNSYTVECTQANLFDAECSTMSEGSANPLDLPDRAYAIQTRSGKGQDISLRVLIEDENVRNDLEEEMQKAVSDVDDRQPFILVEVRSDNPDLIVEVLENHLHFCITDEICVGNGLSCMPRGFDITLDLNGKNHCKELLSFLSSAAHFYWHFRHSNQELSDNPASDRLNQKIEIQCLKIVQSGSGIGNRLESIFVPDSTVSKNFNVNGTILIDITDQETYYGFKIINNWESPLYAVLFYFGIGDLEIESYYHPGDARKNVEISIPAEGYLNIGFGDSGTAPREFYLRLGETVDVGFLKLYLSTNSVNLSSVAQRSPLDTGYSQERAQREVQRPKIEAWDTIVIPIIQKKKTSD